MPKSSIFSLAQVSGTCLLLLCLFIPQEGQAVCNYANASANNNWGWDAETNKSCRPRAQHSSNAQCEDHGGYPWGWNSVNLESCRLDQTTMQNACIDTEPKGDGWGWNGITSCVIAMPFEALHCDDSGNYPWGWNPTTNVSCRLDLVSIVEMRAEPVSYLEFVNLPLECRKIQKQNVQGRDVLAEDNQIFYSATLKPLTETELAAASYSGVHTAMNQEVLYSFVNEDRVFIPVPSEVAPWEFLYELSNNHTPSIGFLRFERLPNGSFNISERDSETRANTTSRCVVR